MSRAAADPLERRSPPRLYAHLHRLLIDLLEDLSENARVLWLTGEGGHIRRSEGEPNSYRKALYALVGLEPLPGASGGVSGGAGRGT